MKNGKNTDFGNRFVRIIGLLGFIVATVAFLLVLSGVPVDGAAEEATAPGIVLFNAFIMCAALAFAGIMITTLAHISDSLRSIEGLLEKAASNQEKESPAKKAASKKATNKKE